MDTLGHANTDTDRHTRTHRHGHNHRCTEMPRHTHTEAEAHADRHRQTDRETRRNTQTHTGPSWTRPTCPGLWAAASYLLPFFIKKIPTLAATPLVNTVVRTTGKTVTTNDISPHPPSKSTFQESRSARSSPGPLQSLYCSEGTRSLFSDTFLFCLFGFIFAFVLQEASQI